MACASTPQTHQRARLRALCIPGSLYTGFCGNVGKIKCYVTPLNYVPAPDTHGCEVPNIAELGRCIDVDTTLCPGDIYVGYCGNREDYQCCVLVNSEPSTPSSINTTKPATPNSQVPSQGDIRTWILPLIIVAIVLFVGAIIGVVILKVRQRKAVPNNFVELDEENAS